MRSKASDPQKALPQPWSGVYGLLVAIGVAPDPNLPKLREPLECVVVTQINKNAGVDVP